MSKKSEKAVSLKLFHDRVLIRVQPEPTASVGGIILPEAATRRRYGYGEVVAVGDGSALPVSVGSQEIALSPMSVAVGDKILFDISGGMDIDLNGEKLRLFRDADLIGALE